MTNYLTYHKQKSNQYVTPSDRQSVVRAAKVVQQFQNGKALTVILYDWVNGKHCIFNHKTQCIAGNMINLDTRKLQRNSHGGNESLHVSIDMYIKKKFLKGTHCVREMKLGGRMN